MKKYLLVLFIIMVFSSLAFGQDPTMEQLGIKGPSGWNIVYGQTVSVRAQCEEAIVLSAGFHIDDTNFDDKIKVYYYSEGVPSTISLLGSIDHDVSNISVNSNVITCEFTLSAYTGGTARSMQIMTGIWDDNGNSFGPRGTSYLNEDVSAIGNPGGYYSWLWNNYGNDPLPVTLTSFTVALSGQPVINWETQSEINNAYWNIYRSISQNMGQAIQINYGDMILGQGTATELTYYSYTDNFPVLENTTYWYWLKCVDNAGEADYMGPVSLFIPEGNGNNETPATPDDYGLKQNFPNPFNPDTRINFALVEDSPVQLIIYNIKGEKVKTIFEEFVPADMVQTAYWDGKDESGKTVATGVYLYRLRTNKTDFMKRMLLMK